jgi:hypothetical protein
VGNADRSIGQRPLFARDLGRSEHVRLRAVLAKDEQLKKRLQATGYRLQEDSIPVA